MSEFKKLSHVIYRCDNQILWTPKYRFRILEGMVKEQMREAIEMLLEWLGCEKKELNIQIDHIHLPASPIQESKNFNILCERCVFFAFFALKFYKR